MRKTVICSLLLLLCFLSSCDLDDDNDVNFHFTTLQTISADLPENFELNETYTITVTYFRPNDCTFFDGFDVQRTETTTRNVVIIGSVLTNQGDCEEIAREGSTSFQFQVLYQEPYLFRFWTGTNENDEDIYLEIEVPVNP